MRMRAHAPTSHAVGATHSALAAARQGRTLPTMSVAFMEPVELATRLREKRPVLVLDVRDEDFQGGNIAGAYNLPSELWHDGSSLDNFIQDCLAGVEEVVVHCMFSQQRGPRCAMQLARRLAAQQGQPSVYVLRGGWQGFLSQYITDADLLESIKD